MKMKEAGVSFRSKEEAMMGKVETFLNDCCAILRLSVCECEMYILYTPNLKGGWGGRKKQHKNKYFNVSSLCNSDFGAKTNVYLQCLFSRN